MQIAQSKTKYKLIISIMGAAMFFSAAEVGILSKYYPQNAHGAGIFFIFISTIFYISCVYHYIKATKEDKLSEGL